MHKRIAFYHVLMSYVQVSTLRHIAMKTNELLWNYRLLQMPLDEFDQEHYEPFAYKIS